jgi:hypothetical protein
MSLTSSLVLLGALCLDPHETAIEQHVDLIEVNHFHDECGKHVFDQLIFYDWCSRYCRNQVVAWRLIKSPAQLPIRDWKRGDYVCTWNDNGLLRSVRASSLRESWTQYDPELLEREILPLSERRELARPLGRDAR